MIKRITLITALLGIASIPSLAAADTMAGISNPETNTAEFTWHINSKGFLVVSVTNTSGYTGVITSLQFEVGAGGDVVELVDVDGTGRDGAWNYTTDAKGCYSPDCVITGSNFFNGRGNVGIAVGTTADFRFVGDFTDLSDISNVLVRFQRTGETQRGTDAAWGCLEGCAASEVPEPGMLVLFGTGLLGLHIAWRRRERSLQRA